MQDIKTYENEMSSIFKKVYQYAKGFAFLGLEPDDIAQDALIKVLLRKEERPPTCSWLYLTVKSAAYDLGRKRRSALNLITKMSERKPTGSVCENRDEYEVSLDGRQKGLNNSEPEYCMDTIEYVLEQLSPEHRNVLILYAAGCEYADIAASTDTKIGTVRSRLHHARKKAWQILKAVS